MTSYVLDTNVVSALMRGDSLVLSRLAAVRRSDVAVPEPVFAEIEYGIRRLPASRKRDHLRVKLRELRGELRSVAWTPDVSAHFGDIKAALERRGSRIEDLDVAIAAHARATGATLVTANAAHMARVPDSTLEDWAAADE